jgi:ribonuclease HI
LGAGGIFILKFSLDIDETKEYLSYLFDRYYLYKKLNPNKSEKIAKEILKIKSELEKQGYDYHSIFKEIEGQIKIVHKEEKVIAYVDGASRNTHDKIIENDSAIALVLYDGSELVMEDYKRIEPCSSVIAEYKALINSLRVMLKKGYRKREILIYSDYKPIVNQINMIYRTKNPKLVALRDEARSLIERFSFIKIQYIPREGNAYADMLANRALDEGGEIYHAA